MPNETIQAVLTQAKHRWRPATAWTDGRPENRAREIARKAAEICMVRGVLPELVGVEIVTEVVIPPPSRTIGVIALELATLSHGPVVVRCEYGSDLVGAAELVEAAVEASVFARGWAPIYVRLWQEVLHG